MNRAYTPTRRDFSRDGAPLLSVVKASQAARVPDYALDDAVEWDLGDGKGKQYGRVVMMAPSVTVIKQANGTIVRLAIDRPRRAGT